MVTQQRSPLSLFLKFSIHGIDIGANISGFQMNNLRFADDIVLSIYRIPNPKELQTLVNRVQKASNNFGLKMNISKTEV